MGFLLGKSRLFYSKFQVSPSPVIYRVVVFLSPRICLECSFSGWPCKRLVACHSHQCFQLVACTVACVVDSLRVQLWLVAMQATGHLPFISMLWAGRLHGRLCTWSLL